MLLTVLLEVGVPGFHNTRGQIWRLNIVHLHVMHENLRRKAFQDPNVPEGFLRCHAVAWVQLEALLHKV